MKIIPNTRRKIFVLLGLPFFLMFNAYGNAQEKSKIFSIGVVIDDPNFSEHLDWFKASMAEFGYVENENIRYSFYGFVENKSGIDDIEIQKVLSDNPDLIFTAGNYSASWAKRAIEGTDIPAIFCSINSNPVTEGMADSLSFPKGNITGIRVPDIIPKALEWLAATVPGIKRIYLPYNPSDEISVLAIRGLDEVASKLGVELIIQKVHSTEEAVEAIETLDEDIDAIFTVPTLTLDRGSDKMNQAAIKRKLPLGAADKQDESALVTFRPDNEQAGKQAARLANQILQGVNPSDLPIETLEVTLTINLKIAEKLGILIPDSVLMSADTIIR